MTEIQNLRTFFKQPGINISGVLREAQMSMTHLFSVLNGQKELKGDSRLRLLGAVKKYGFQEKSLTLSQANV